MGVDAAKRVELIRSQQRSKSPDVTAVMVSLAADISPHPFRPMHGSDTCWECDERVYAPIHQPPLPKWIKCANGHVLETTDAYRFVLCPWCQANLTVQW